MKNKLKNNLKKINSCPICKSKKYNDLGKIIHCNNSDLNKLFNLLECIECQHRFLSRFPNIKFLNKLYLKNSSYVFGHTKQEILSKKNFIKKKFVNQKAHTKHWIFNYLMDIEKGKYLEIGPGLCNLYKAFYDKGWKCEGVELQKWIKAPGLVNNFKKLNKKKSDVIVLFDVLEHTINPIKFLKLISKKHKTNGKLFLTYPNANSCKSKILKTNWPMVSPLAHINFFSHKSTLILLKKCGYKKIELKSYSFVELRRLIRNTIKLPFKIIFDLLGFNFKIIVNRLSEFLLNLLDLFNGDQMKVVAVKIK